MQSTTRMPAMLAKYVKTTVLMALFLSGSFGISAQRTININHENSVLRSSQTLERAQLTNSYFGQAEQARAFDFNPQLKSLTQQNEGDILLLDFFEGKQYRAMIKKVSQSYDGVIGITAKVEGTDFGYCFISISENGILINTELPETNELFRGTNNYLSEYKMSEARRNDLPCIALEPPKPLTPASGAMQVKSIQTKAPADCSNTVTNVNTAATIRVLVVYTEKARLYALNQSSTIDYEIQGAIDKANLASSNSNLGITFEIAHKYETTYQEVNTDEDLDNLTNPNDGKLDEVHAYRRQYSADLVMFVPEVNFTGGIGWVLGNYYPDGAPAYGFALSRIQQLNTYTLVHEIGHNMGCGHHRDQLVQAGPGRESYSAGWKGTINAVNLCTIMTYGASRYWNDGSSYNEIPYFSSPLISYPGSNVYIGDDNTADNARTLRETKHIVAFYKTLVNNTVLTNLKVNSAQINGFDADTYNYSLSTDETTITIEGTTGDCASVSGNVTNAPLNYGDNTFTISVTSSDGTFANAYIVTVNRTLKPCDSYPSRPAFSGNVTAQAGDNALNLNMSPAVPVEAVTSLAITSSQKNGNIIIGESLSSRNTCDDDGGTVYILHEGVMKIRVATTGNYSFSNLSQCILSVFDSSDMSCGHFVGSNAYWTTAPSFSSTSSLTVSLTANTDYYIRAIYGTAQVWNISVSGTGSVLLESAIPTGANYTYIAVDNLDGTIKMQSATGDFRTLPAGTYTIYGAPYSQADPATFIGKTLAEIATSACVIPSTTFITMTVTGVPAHDISIGSFTGGSVSASSPSSADGADVPVGETVTLTISTDTGYKLTGIEAHKTNEANTPVTLSGSGDGNGATRTFEMPAYGVTVTATFGYTDDQQALLDAKQAIEGVTSYTVVQANAHDEASLKMALATVLNTLLTDNTINYTVAAADITIAASPVYAVAGTAGNTNGTNGSFSFTVSLHKSGTTTATTASKSGIITATPYDATQDNTDIGAAKTTVENATYTTTQAEVQNITQAKAKVEGIIGTLTLNGVTATVADGTFDAAIAGTATNANGTDGSYTFTVTLTKGAGTSQTTINLTLLITATAYDPTPDIDAAKTLVEATNYEDTQVNIPDLAAARARVTAVISTLNLNGVTPTVADGTFTGATAGTDGSPNGTNGSYTFTVQLEKAGVQQTTNLLTLLITATPYTPPSTHLVNISPTTNGTVIASPVNPVTENTTVTLTITPDAGYELETISTTPPLTLDGTGNSRTFTMPTQDVTVNATFKKTADQLAVEAAQVAIEGMNNPTVAQATANTEAAVKTWLAGQINTLLTGYTVTADDITLSNPVYATAGTTTNQSGMNGSFSFTVSLQKGNSKTLATASRNGTITATPYDATQDNTDIAAVKVLIENASYTDTQANIPAIAEAKAAVETIIFNLSLNGVTPTVVDGTFTGATAGTAGSPNGTNGSYTFTVKLNKGGGAEQTTAQLTLTITATPYTAPDTYLVNIITPTNGTVTASPAGAVTETTGITLTITPSAGYELDEIKAYKTGDDATTVALLGAGATRTFDMPAFSVTVEATFTKTADQLDVEAAKTAIEGMANTTVAQATANSEATVKAWLAQQINALAGMNVTGITVAASDITLSGFSAAVAGTVGNLPGTNGSFSFSVSLKKNGSATLTTASKAGIITATPYDPAQDNADITAAQSAIENASYTDTQVNIPTQAAARAKVESIIGGLNLNGVTTTLLEGAFTAATAGTAADTDGTDGSYTFTVRLNKGGGTEQITAQLTLAITATPYDASQDNADIATAKTQVENATYTDTQANIPAIAEAKAAVEAILSGLSLNGVVTTVVDGVFTAAIAGTDITPNGTDGSYTFYVKLNKGGGAEQTTIELTLAITATPYAAAGTYQVNVGLTTNGTVTASPANPVSENATVTLTITPAEGYELDNLSTMPPLTLDGTGNTRTFDMPAQDVTVNATFTKTADQLAVETAQTLIEGLTNATVDQATANTEATVKAWLAQQINALAGMNATGITVAAADITLSGFAAAAEGTAGNPPGTNGSFSFTVSLKKNSSATLTTSSRNGVIIATPYSAIAYTVSIGTMANGTVTAQPASATAGTNITLTISPAAGYELEAISTTPALTLNGSGNTRTFTMPANDLTVNATFRTTSDQSLVEAAKAAIEGMGNVSVHQATANSEATVKAWLAQQINALQGVSATGIIVTVADITLGGFTAAVAGDDGNPSGTDGSFTFTVSLQKGASATVTTAGRNGEIIATAYSAPLYAVTIGTITNGTVSAYPSRAIAGETVRLTLSPAEGYELDTIRTTPSLTLSGSGNSRTFAMPASAVTVTATFKKTQAQQDKEAVQAAKIAIEGGLYRIAQATGNTATSIKTWLLSTFNVMFGQLHNTQFRSTGTPIVGDVTIGNITPALSGTEASPSGTNGEFEFTVTLTRGATTLTTFTTTGVIVATPHSTVPMKRIELIPLNELTVRILNTGNLATGNLTLALSGANADVFTLPAATTVSLSIGDETEVALSVRDNLPAGTYKATLTVSGEGMTPVTLEISYSNNATGIDGQQANTFRAWVRSGLLYVTGLTPGKPWSIYGISGTLIYQGKAESVDAKIGLPARGIYVVTSGNSVLKVVY